MSDIEDQVSYLEGRVGELEEQLRNQLMTGEAIGLLRFLIESMIVDNDWQTSEDDDAALARLEVIERFLR